jgi:drug/metabolite transporter (DMT)-like permease
MSVATETTILGNAAVPENRNGGILLRLVATLLFTLMALSVRLASVEAPTGQIVFWRSAVALVPIVLYLAWRGQLPGGLRTNRPMGHLMRSLLGGSAMFFSFISLAHLPLVLATALGFLAPLLVVPAAIAFLKERPGPVVIAASIAGFIGVVIMLLPAMEGPSLDRSTLIGVAAGIAMAVVTAAAKVQIKALTATEAPGTIAFYFAVVCSILGLLTWPFGWTSPSGPALLALVASGLFGGLAHIAMTEALARAPASTLAPFEYTAPLWAVLFDIVIFVLLPTTLGLVGAGIIVAAAMAVAFADRVPFKSAMKPHS